MTDQNILSDIISDLSKRYWQEREKQIEQRLSESGYTFASKDDFYAFAKDHLTLARYKDRPFYQEIRLDGKLLDWWETEPEFKFDQNTHTYKIIFG